MIQKDGNATCATGLTNVSIKLVLIIIQLLTSKVINIHNQTVFITVPEEFQFDPVTKSYGDPSRRPEVKTSTIEFIAPSEYMVSTLDFFSFTFETIEYQIAIRFHKLIFKY